MRILDAPAVPRTIARYAGRALPDLSYATVEEFCDSADHLPQLCRLDGDLKDAQRPWAVKAILGLVAPGGRLLEIGGGEPLVAAALHDLGYDVTLVDPYEGAGNGPTSYQAYVQAFPEVRIRKTEFGPSVPGLDERSFDAIYSISVLEHIPHDKLDGIFGGIARYLHPGGRSIHCIDHVAQGWGIEYHLQGLRRILALQAGLSDPAATSDAGTALDYLLDRLAGDVETFFLSGLGHHRWRGRLAYPEFRFRKVVSIQTCAQAWPRHA